MSWYTADDLDAGDCLVTVTATSGGLMDDTSYTVRAELSCIDNTVSFDSSTGDQYYTLLGSVSEVLTISSPNFT